MVIDEPTRARLLGAGEVFLRVTDSSGKVLTETARKVRLEGDPLVRNDLEVSTKPPIFTVDTAGGTRIFRRRVEARGPVVRPTPEPAPTPGRDPDPNVEPRARLVRLEDVTGIGPARARKLREAGVVDARALVALTASEQTALLGAKARTIVRAARKAIIRADANEQEGTMHHAPASKADTPVALRAARRGSAAAGFADPTPKRDPHVKPALFRGPCACGGGCPRCAGTGIEVQAKMRIDPARGPAEAEANRLADKVVNMTGAGPVPVPAARSGPGPQGMRRAPEPAAAGKGAISLPPAAESAVRGLGPGHRLPASERAFFEPRFGMDLSHVRLHSGATPERLNNSIGARAFTHGSDIVFGRGEYRPGTGGGQKLLAHELTHVAPATQRRRRRSHPAGNEV